MSVSRRGFLKHAGTGLVTTAGVLALPGSASAASHGMRVSGSGSYALGPFTHGDDPNREAYLITDLGFDETMVYCKVTTNFEPLIFPTAELGHVPLAAHTFFMDMQSTRIDSLVVQDGPDGLPRAIYTGVMSSETRVGPYRNPVHRFFEHDLADGFQARRVIGEWIDFYNAEQPHSALGGKTPAEAYRGDRKIDPRRFWRDERQPEYTLNRPPSCPQTGATSRYKKRAS